MDELKTRREFLARLSLLLTSSLAAKVILRADGSFAAELAGAVPFKPSPLLDAVKIADWTGDDFTVGHEFRDRKFPGSMPTPAAAEKTVDFVIVGGGIAGLSAAYYLKDHDVLLLEQYHDAGGNSRGGSFNNIDYSYGPYFVRQEDGIFGKLYSDLGLTSLPYSRDENLFLQDGNWEALLKGLPGHNPYSSANFPEGIDAAHIAQRDNQKAVALSGDDLMLNQSCRAYFCANHDQISDLADGYLRLSLLSSQNRMFKGGNSAVTKALVAKLSAGAEGRLKTNAFVWKIELKDDGASVVYGSGDGSMHRVECRHVIIATPPMVAQRQVTNFDDALKAKLMQFKYGAYLVANCHFKGDVNAAAYMNWENPQSKIAGFVRADQSYKSAAETGAVLTVLQPYVPGSEGRTLLLEGDRQKFASSIVTQLAASGVNLKDNLDEIVLSRFGHSMAIPNLGYFGRIKAIRALQKPAFSLAHSSLHGFPSIESAIRGGKLAADRALATKKVSHVF